MISFHKAKATFKTAAFFLFIAPFFTVALTATQPAQLSKYLSAQAEDIPSGFESYLSRPDPLKVKPQAHPDLGGDWPKLKRAHLEAVAMLLETYPDREIYFLARDSELLYDLAKWEAKDDPAILKRLHLLNISRANMRADHVREYLAQEGISDKALRAGKKVLFVDTGFSGTIPSVIGSYFPSDLRPQLRTHLMSSSNPNHPSSRAFLTALNPAAPMLHPGSMHGTIISYEHLPRYTDRSNQFVFAQGKWQPISNKSTTTDGSVNKTKAVKYMEDLLNDAGKSESRKLMKERRAKWRRLRDLYISGNADKLSQELRGFLQAHPNDPFVEAIARDFIELTKTLNLPPTSALNLSESAIGLSQVVAGQNIGSNKIALIQKHPEWAPILEDPEYGVKMLIDKQEFGTLGAITDTIHDEEIHRILAKALVERSEMPGVHAFVKMLLEKGDQKIIKPLVNLGITAENAVEKRDLVRLIFEHGEPEMVKILVMHALAGDQTGEMQDMIKLLLEKGDQGIIRYLAIYTFKPDQMVKFKDLARRLIEEANEDVIDALRKYTFAYGDKNVHAAELKDLKEAAFIDDQAKRIAFLNERLGPASVAAKPSLKTKETPVAQAVPETKKTISPGLKAGDEIRTQEGRELRIVKYADQGKRGVVFQAQDSQGKTYALKVAKDQLPETLESISKESKKAANYEKYGIRHARILEASSDYVLKEWVDGTRADEWIKSWVDQGQPKNAEPIKKLQALIHSNAGSGVYVGDLNPKNLIWNGKDWVVIDSGSVKEGLAAEEVLSRYLENVPRRWSKAAKESACSQQVLESLHKLLFTPVH